MADNVVSNAGTGGATFAADDIGGIHFPRSKIVIGADGTNDGDVSAANPLPVGGNVAHDAADSGNPQKVGAQARSTDPTAVASADRANLIADLLGKLIVLPYAIPENFVSGATSAITDTTSTSVIASAGSGRRNYITSVLVTNSHATVGTRVDIKDGSGGTTLYSGYAAPVGGGFAVTFPVPLRGTAATALHAVCGTTGSNIYVSAAGYTAP